MTTLDNILRQAKRMVDPILVEEKKILATVTIDDVVNRIIDQYKEENKHLRDFIYKY